MFFRRRPVKIVAQVYDKWSFQIEAPGAEAAAALNQWVTTMNATRNHEPASPAPRMVGFNRTPACDLGESSADTEIAAPATDEDADADDDD